MLAFGKSLKKRVFADPNSTEAGRKMSKSLKNFVTIREMLGISCNISDDEVKGESTDSHQHQPSAWSCPSDDFRLWCLGLSGSYRGPATYSKDRMDEARVIRTKWVKFLMEGQQYLDDWKAAETDTDAWRFCTCIVIMVAPE